MNQENNNSEDARLTALLRQARPSPDLPPRFHEGVWRRIEKEREARPGLSWLDALAALALRPRVVLTSVVVLVVAGAALGAYQGGQMAQHDAQARYLALVAPNPLH